MIFVYKCYLLVRILLPSDVHVFFPVFCYSCALDYITIRNDWNHCQLRQVSFTAAFQCAVVTGFLYCLLRCSLVVELVASSDGRLGIGTRVLHGPNIEDPAWPSPLIFRPVPAHGPPKFIRTGPFRSAEVQAWPGNEMRITSG